MHNHLNALKYILYCIISNCIEGFKIILILMYSINYYNNHKHYKLKSFAFFQSVVLEFLFEIIKIENFKNDF